MAENYNYEDALRLVIKMLEEANLKTGEKLGTCTWKGISLTEKTATLTEAQCRELNGQWKPKS